jgi:hypothetical protein
VRGKRRTLALAEEDRLAAQLALVRLRGSSFPNTSSFGAGGKSRSSWNSAMKCTWLPRSSGFTPFFAAVAMSPSK